MEINENANVDTSQVDDVRGRGGGGFGGMIPGGGKTIGGGVVGLLIAVVAAFLGVNGLSSGVTSDSNTGDNTSIAQRCAKSNPDRFEQTDCRQVVTFNDLRDYWGQNLFPTLNAQYRDPRFTIFQQAVNTGCGQATSAVGPFYCPADQRIYIDLGFYDELASRFGATGEFAQAYVIAHEFGHHIQTLTGTEPQVRRLQQRRPDLANRYSVALELQADCYAGVWTKNATGGSQPLITGLTQQDIDEALQAAAAVGDDRIQQKAGQTVNPETWTHGSAEQRQQWFTRGYSTGDPRSCDTFAGG